MWLVSPTVGILQLRMESVIRLTNNSTKLPLFIYLSQRNFAQVTEPILSCRAFTRKPSCIHLMSYMSSTLTNCVISMSPSWQQMLKQCPQFRKTPLSSNIRPSLVKSHPKIFPSPSHVCLPPFHLGVCGCVSVCVAVYPRVLFTVLP